MESPFQWFAMRATYKRELVAKEYLESKGFEVFVPMKWKIKTIKGIKHKLHIPAINSLIFVYAAKDDLQRAKFGKEYIQYLTRKLDGRNVPIIVPDYQMNHFKMVVEDDAIEKSFFYPGEVDLARGTKVKVHGGALDGYKGIILKIKGKRDKQLFINLDGVVAVCTKIENFDLIELV